MKITIVDKKDKIIAYKDPNLLDYTKDIYRVSALWLTNSYGEILLAKRAYSKSHDPGKWGPAVAGTVDKGETYEDNIKKETEEELGISGLSFVKGPKMRSTSKYQFFAQWFFAKTDKKTSEFEIQKEELDEIKWFSKQELLKAFKNTPENFISGFADKITAFLI